MLRRHLDGLVQITRLGEEVAPELLLGLGIRAVGDDDLAVSRSQAHGVLGGGERADLQQVAAALQILVEGPALTGDRGHVGLGQGLELRLVVVGQTEILHVSSPLRQRVDRRPSESTSASRPRHDMDLKMTKHRARYGPHNPDETYIAHELPERLVDLGEVQMNYATLGEKSSPSLLLIPGQTESWWGYEAVMPRLAAHFEVFAVDLRGQGRSTRTPGRYTLDNMGNDLVRFIDTVIGRSTYVSGLSSGGVLAAWLSAYARPGQVIAALYEDPPLFASELRPAMGPGIRQCIGPVFDLWSTYLGDHWSIGAWDAMREAAPERLPEWMRDIPVPEEPPQNLKEYDPEWGRSFWTGTVAASCDHERMLRSVKVPVLLTHHMRITDDATGFLLGAMSDQHARRVRDLLQAAGVPVEYRSFPDVGHSMHGDKPDLYVDTLLDWVKSLGM